MIEKIILQGIPSFINGTEIAPLKAVNYFYGANGTGKTSISRVLNDINSFSGCKLDCANSSSLPIYVYNRDFVEKNFSNKIKGIFTLGKFAEASHSIENLIAELKEKESQLNNEKLQIDGSESTNGLLASLKIECSTFEEECWKVRTKIPDVLRSAYTPYQGSKAAFSKEIIAVLEESDLSKEDFDIQIIVKDAEEFLNKHIEAISLVELTDFRAQSHVTGEEILSKKIIGKSDVDVAAMIQSLQSSDWVRKGQSFLAQSNGYCPFCQQNLPLDFAQKLEKYFDESYLKYINLIDEFESKYTSMINSINTSIDKLKDANKFIENDKIEHFFKKIDLDAKYNLQIISQKKREPTSLVAIRTINKHLLELKEYLDSVNVKVAKHNEIASNLNKNREDLKRRIWRYTASQLSLLYKVHKANKGTIESEITEKSKVIKVLSDNIADIKSRIGELERSRTGTAASIAQINSILEKFGFSSFRIHQADETGYYKLIRNDGSSAHTTLSEGEKSFITFLYFYHLLLGSHTEDGIVEDRIVVFDDPISSLDSEILFIVSEIIRRIINSNMQKKEPGNIKQFFIFTHNVYFFKEVTYKSHERQKKQNTYYIIRKNSESSECCFYEKSPIESSYALLWREMAECKHNITIQNILRRILEVYFTHFGDFNSIRGLAESFEGKDKIIYNSLMSWTNAGSHSIYDDLYISRDDFEIDKYKDVFRRIFDAKGHLSHYVMMYNKYHKEPIMINADEDN